MSAQNVMLGVRGREFPISSRVSMHRLMIMAGRVLSQNEIDSVFETKAVTRQTAVISRYDFKKLDSVAPEVLRRIQMVTEGFARRMSSSLAAFLRRYVEAVTLSIEQLSFGDFVTGLTSPTCIRTMMIKPMGTGALLELSTDLAFAALEALLGSRRGNPSVPNRELTEAEHSVLESAFRVLLADLHEAWLPLVHVEFVFDPGSPPPDQLLSLTEGIVVASFDVRVGDVSGLMNIAMPSAFLKRLQRDIFKDKDVSRSANEAHKGKLLRLVGRSRVDLEVVLQGACFPASRLASLGTGDVLLLDHPEERPFDLLLDGSRKYTVQVLPSPARRSASIVAPVLDSRVRNHGLVKHATMTGL